MAKILVIENDAHMRANLAELLELNNFSVISAPDGQIGFELAQTNLPDLILCDIGMPQVSGYQVLRQLREAEVTALIPFIFLTAKADHADLRRGMELGADDYLVKPFAINDLIRAIGAQLQKREHLAKCFARSHAFAQPYTIDPITGLANLAGIEARFNQITHTLSASSSPVCLVLLELQGYRELQEQFGHIFGQTVLRTIANCLQTWADTSELAIDTIAYIGSERFALLLMIETHTPTLTTINHSLQEALSQPLTVNNHTLQIKYRLGQTCYADTGQDFNNCLLKTIQQISTHSQPAQSSNLLKPHLSIEARLKQALNRGEFELYYQPQVDLRTAQVIGAEALVRWNSPDEGLVPPTQFIPVAEASGLIFPISEWVLRSACQQIAHWQQAAFSVVKVAINLSAKQFQARNLQRRLVSILDEENIDPSLIDLELTENLLIDDIDHTCRILNELRAAGFAIVIDDFGTGYSSLGYLQRFPVNILKIDKCFVRHLDSNLSNLVIVKAIIEMAHGLKISTIAEGVETAEELATLRPLNCDAMQGYLFSQPLCASDFEVMIARAYEKHITFLANC